jgi:hypothetical protein
MDASGFLPKPRLAMFDDEQKSEKQPDHPRMTEEALLGQLRDEGGPVHCSNAEVDCDD